MILFVSPSGSLGFNRRPGPLGRCLGRGPDSRQSEGSCGAERGPLPGAFLRSSEEVREELARAPLFWKLHITIFFFFSLFLFLFDWRTIMILWWFCHIAIRIVHRYTTSLLHPETLSPPSLPNYPSSCHRYRLFGCPVACIKLRLAIYFAYGNIHLSALFSHISHLSFPHWVQKSVSLCLCVLWCPAQRIVSTTFLDST